jgi:thiol:disulfide interchange protein DsbA
MSLRRFVLLLGGMLALAACGKTGSNGHAPEASRAPAGPSHMVAAQHPAASTQKPAEQASDLPSKITRMNEDGSETIEDVPSDSGAHNPLLAAVASTVAASTPSAAAATATGAPAAWQEGVNYTRLVPAQPTDVPQGQVEVLEFFWYACPHCKSIDPLVETWKNSKPAYVTFSRVHVMWSEAHRALARLYYTMVTLGKIDQVHGEIFKEIHERGNPLVAADPGNAIETERIQTAFATKYGISAADFKQAYHSFAVQTALQRADQLVQRYRVEGVPTFVINGKYVADVRSAETPERLLTLVGDLAAQEHKR